MLVIDQNKEYSDGYSGAETGLFSGISGDAWLGAGVMTISSLGKVATAFKEAGTAEKIAKAQQKNLSMQMGMLSTQIKSQEKALDKQLEDNAAKRDHELVMLNAMLTDKAMSRKATLDKYYTEHQSFLDDKAWNRALQVRQLEAQTQALKSGAVVPGVAPAIAVAPPIEAKMLTPKNIAIAVAVLALVGSGIYYFTQKP